MLGQTLRLIEVLEEARRLSSVKQKDEAISKLIQELSMEIEEMEDWYREERIKALEQACKDQDIPF